VTLLLTRRDVADLLTIDDCIDAVENAFAMLGRGEVPRPAIAGVHGNGGGFHMKAAVAGDRFAVKMNSNFFEAKPRIKGVVILCDANDGRVLAVMDSIEITILRTGAATAVAAKYLARENAKTALICGCGNQGRIQARALQRVRKLDRIFAFDENRDVAANFAEEIGAEAVPAITWADIVVTCTPSRSPILHKVQPGTFVAAVGTDSEEKSEIAPQLMMSSKVVTDLTEQCRAIGDLHHAPDAAVYAELSEIVAGNKRGRERDDETIVFDSTGMALQDVAAAAIVYDRAVAAGRGTRIDFAAF
jgi:ornithine cyclodeaminase/alanine dehydrogenase-like protein (mu-crystallin family)